MRSKGTRVATLFFASFLLSTVSLAQTRPDNPSEISTPDRVESRLGTLQFHDGMPSPDTADKIYDQLDYVHGVNTFLNAYSAVNMWALRKGLIEAGVNDNDVLIFSGLMDSKSLFLTANADTVYFFAFVDMSKGPMVVEAPPLSLAIVDDMWWRYVTDMGFAGPDRGAGGRYLLVPPGYQGPLPDGGFFISRSRTTHVGILGRAFLDDAGPQPAVDRIKTTLRIYPYVAGTYGTSIADILRRGATPPLPWTQSTSGAALQSPVMTKFVEGTGRVMNTIPPSDLSFFDMLNDAVQDQPIEALDPEIAGSFAAIGIVKGKPFTLDGRMRKVLAEALAVANAAARTLAFRPRTVEGFNYYGAASAWVNTLFASDFDFMTPPPQVGNDGVKPFSSDGARKLNSRVAMFYLATGITPAMVMHLTNIGAARLAAFVDARGQPFDGAKTYKVVLPKGIPAEKFWSVTLYDNQTRSMLQTDQRFPRSGSQGFPSTAAIGEGDGSTTVYFGPQRPRGISDGNWIETVPGKGWFVLLRIYSPLPAFFDKSWRPGEIEEVRTEPLPPRASTAEIAQSTYAFKGGFPTGRSALQAQEDADFERAVTAYRFWYPVVSTEGIFNGARAIGIQDGRAIGIVAASPRQMAFTANSDSPYGFGVVDLANGPVVIELPPGPFIGLINDHYQQWVLDMGLPGPDAGKGGKHLVLPPGYEGRIPSGYYVGRSLSVKNLLAVRTLPAGGDVKTAMDALRRIKIYPLATAAAPQLLQILEVNGRTMDATPLRWEENIKFWEVLHRIINTEPLINSFLPMYGLLSTLGVEKDKPFVADTRMTSILQRAAKAGRDQLLVSAFDSARLDRIVWSDRKWEWVGLVAGGTEFETPGGVDLEARDRWFAQAVATSPAMFRRTTGAGSLYWMSARDKTGAYLDGAKTYKLTVPQPVPGRLFWSVTVYDAATRSQVQTDQNKAALRSLFEVRSSTPSLALGGERIDLYFGPAPPPDSEGRWIKTLPGRGWFAYLRIYGPEQPAFDGSWKPDDFAAIESDNQR
jgi:hypothetical protein